MKNILALWLALCLLLLPCVMAQETATVPEQGPSGAASPIPEGTGSQPDVPSPEPGADAPKLFLDNTNIYENMEKSYSQGYMPAVRGNEAILVLPLLCEGELKGNCLRARVGLGDAQSPFIKNNYEKTVELSLNPVNQGKKQVEGYCVSFPLALKSQRVNGSYPVAIEIMAAGNGGAILQETFTVYVTIWDGKDPDASPEPKPTPRPSPEEPAVLPPRVVVTKCEAASLEKDAVPGTVNAGNKMRLKAWLKNTSKTEKLENLLVTAAAPTENFSLESTSDSIF